MLDAALVWALLHAGLNPYVARAIALCATIAFTFALNRFATFKAQGAITVGEVVAYVSASGAGIAINYGVFAICLQFAMPWLLAMVMGTAVASAFNFFAYRRIFKK